MVTPNISPDSSRPSEIEEDPQPITNPTADGDPETVTQEDLARSDGAGIRGDYGDAEQTNGLEGGADAATDAGPDRADQNPTNASQAD